MPGPGLAQPNQRPLDMTIQQIDEQQAQEARVFQVARKITEIHDGLADVELPDDRDAAEEAVQRGELKWDVSLFDHWWPQIIETRRLYAPNIIETLHADGSRMPPEEIARLIGIVD